MQAIRQLPNHVVSWWHYLVSSKLHTTCWFCGQEAIIGIAEKDKWFCRYCEQQNGFKDDGDYVHPIPAQFDVKDDLQTNDDVSTQYEVLCQNCAYYQTIKLRQLAAYTPIDEKNYDQEIEEYRHYLENVYRLCQTCERKVLESLKKQDRDLLREMDTDILEKLAASRGHNSDFHRMKKAAKPKSSLIQNVPACLFFLCFIVAAGMSVLNTRLLSTSMTVSSNKILQTCLEVLVNSIGYKTALDLAEILVYCGTALCFTGLYIVGSQSWYPEDAVHLNLWVVHILLSNKDVINLMPALAVSRWLHLLLAVLTAFSALSSMLRSRLPRYLDMVSLGRRQIRPTTANTGYDITSDHMNRPTLLESDHRGQEARNSTVFDHFVKDLKSFSLGTRKSTDSSSSFWPSPGGRESFSSRNSSPGSSPPHSPPHVGHRPVISPSKLKYIDFQRQPTSSPSNNQFDSLYLQTNRSSYITTNHSPPHTSTYHSLPTASPRSPSVFKIPSDPSHGKSPSPELCPPSKSSPNLSRLLDLSSSEKSPPKTSHTSSPVVNQSGLSPPRSAISQPISSQINKDLTPNKTYRTFTDKKPKLQNPGIFNKGDSGESLRRSTRIATKSRPWSLRKAYSCTDASSHGPDWLTAQIDGPVSESRSGSYISENDGSLQNKYKQSNQANENEVLDKMSTRGGDLPDSSTT